MPLSRAGSGGGVGSSMSRWAILALVTAAHGLGALSVLAVAPLAPFLLDDPRLSRAQVGWFLPAVYLGAVLMALPAGWLTDRLGVRATLALGQLVIGVGVVLAALGVSLAACLVCLVLGGFGFSVLNPSTGKAVVEWFPPRERGIAMGVKQTGLTLGGLTAALLLPPIARGWSWRHALATAGLLSIFSAVLVAIFARSRPAPATPSPVERPRLSELGEFLRRPPILVVFGCGLALSVAQSSLLAYLVLYAKDSFDVSAVRAAQPLAIP